MALLWYTNKSSSAWVEHYSLSPFWGNPFQPITTLLMVHFTPWLASKSANLLDFLCTWLKLTVWRALSWIWIHRNTWINLQYFEIFSEFVPQLIPLTESTINSELASIIKFYWFSCARSSKHFSIAINSAMLLVALPKWKLKIERIFPISSLNTPPKLVVPRLPLRPHQCYISENPEGEDSSSPAQYPLS